MNHEPCVCGTDFTCFADEHGCYICRPDWPAAADEGCRRCESDYWRAVLKGFGG